MTDSNSMSTATRYFHGSHSTEATITIENSGIYGGVFCSDETVASSHAASLFSVEIDEDETLDCLSRVDYELIEKVIRFETDAKTDDEIELIFDAIDSDSFASDEAIALMYQIDTDCDEQGHAETQRLRGRVAAAAGYKAVECFDEHGTVLLVVSGELINNKL